MAILQQVIRLCSTEVLAEFTITKGDVKGKYVSPLCIEIQSPQSQEDL